MPDELAHPQRNMIAPLVETGVAAFAFGLLLGLTIFGRWFWAGRSAALPATPPVTAAVIPSALAPSATPVPASPLATSAPLATAAATPSPLPPIYLTLNVNIYPEYTVYWKRDLWEGALSSSPVTEDFESDAADYGELRFPYLTGKGLLLTGQSSAQILNDPNLLPSGHALHFRDWASGLKFSFPNGIAANAFGFDYKPTETWLLTANGWGIPIPKGRRGFVGITFRGNYPKSFVLSAGPYPQGGLTIDNISYLPVNP
jgi:hypothetical protein